MYIPSEFMTSAALLAIRPQTLPIPFTIEATGFGFVLELYRLRSSDAIETMTDNPNEAFPGVWVVWRAED